MGEIDVAAEAFGVGDVVRPGEWAGVQLILTDSSQRQREVLVRIAMEDADGDRPWYEAVVTTNPGVRQPVWLYVRLPYGTAQGVPLLASVFEAEEDEGSELGFTAGRLLGSAAISPRRVLSSVEGMVGIVGSRLFGLGRYGMYADQNPWLPTGHERSELVRGLNANALPDRWLGLAQFDVLVWGEGSPNALSAEKAQAVREWVMRGGHLVVVLPPVGQTWTDEINNPLFDIVPRVRISSREGVDLAPYRGLFSDQRNVTLPARAIVQEMTPLPDAAPGEALRIINAIATGDGAPPPALVTRRLVGVGAVTLVGFDLGTSQLASRGLPDAHYFWHRILGRRGKLQTVEEFTAERASQAGGSALIYGREQITFDRDIPEQIAKSRMASAGVLLGFVVFIAYWAVAGPGGFALLKMKGWTRHAWLAFVGAAGLFTAVAWGGATLIRPHRVDGTHLTFLDHVYGQNVQRARGWISLLIPQYGEAGVSVEDPATLGRPGARPEWHNAVAPWEAPGQIAGGGGFPDARGYRINARSPDTMFVPVRATVKQLRLDWAGGPRWQMPRPVTPEGSGDAGAIRFWEGQVPAGSQQRPLLSGSLVHDLPGPLTDVVIIVNRGQRVLRPINSTTQLLADAFAFKLTGAWEPGQVLDLAAATRTAGERTAALTYFADLLRTGLPDNTAGGIVADPANAGSRLTALAFFSQLSPPDYGITDNRQRRLATRKASHGYDLSLWFTQPCVIVVGQLGAGEALQPSPIPVSVNTDGQWREIHTEGRTVVRWVYPMGERPPEHPDWSDGAVPEAGGPEAGPAAPDGVEEEEGAGEGG